MEDEKKGFNRRAPRAMTRATRCSSPPERYFTSCACARVMRVCEREKCRVCVRGWARVLGG
eukprot:5035973-Pleurochrysis_carterae.AAC.2